MLFFVVSLLVADRPAEPVQPRLDRLVRDCKAENAIRLTARNGHEVVMEFLHPARAPNDQEISRLDCVMKGASAMPDFQFGFIGNEAVQR